MAVILIAFMLFASCEKESEPECWTCTMYSYWNSNRVINISDYCTLSTEEIIAMEQKWRDLGNRYECVKR